MGHAAEQLVLGAEAFLAWNATQTVKHEFLAGEVFAMGGAGEGHVTAAGNLYLAQREYPLPHR